jgi:hypothetical protein
MATAAPSCERLSQVGHLEWPTTSPRGASLNHFRQRDRLMVLTSKEGVWRRHAQQFDGPRGTFSVSSKSLGDLAILPGKLPAVSWRAYLGGCRPGDSSQSLICAPVSHCRARRKSSSRTAPGGSNLASSRRRFASSARRISRDWICLKPRRPMTQPPCLRVLTVGFSTRSVI